MSHHDKETAIWLSADKVLCMYFTVQFYVLHYLIMISIYYKNTTTFFL